MQAEEEEEEEEVLTATSSVWLTKREWLTIREPKK